MTKYIARFMKNVLGENGHEVEICQRVVKVEASTKNQACEMAKLSFCQLENVSEWWLHADSFIVSAVRNPGDAPRNPAGAVSKTLVTS
ncbi:MULTISPECIES: hypothetical protein [Bradyrhizobium]|uniref:Uncharacterized protein n=2 Tax=Bradyrhizobium TaxID=374 RepID=A0ABY0QG54_9BRAD|nr:MULTISPECIES: hypothetical protein [Bradyrhizobium]SDK26894.1 hypothetical protein SAMN05444163_7675 [Bradyrhizobium ottawaense]SEE43180.1 hypothetical protein SAMN05444171_7457 [Bradyrhizobium lablabi]SHM42106.1 hypothetical protein SAMN05444321_6286 [Bradyrhizobium lablabi]